MKKRLLSALVLPMMLTACANNPTTVTSTEAATTTTAPEKMITVNDLNNNNWVLAKIDNQDLVLVEGFEAPSLQLESDLKVNGNAGCNRYFGQAEFKDGQLRIGKMGMTMMLCPDEAMNIEKTFADSLAGWNNVALANDTLTLTGAKHTLTFTKKVAAEAK